MPPLPPQISKLLVYSPQQRLTAVECMSHPFFDELREGGTRLPNGGPLPPLHNWVAGELDGVDQRLVAALQARGGGGSGSGAGSSS